MFCKTLSELKEAGCGDTVREIRQQPETWRQTARQLATLQPRLQAFIREVTEKHDYQIILTGAGSSEFVGNAAVHAMYTKYNGHIHSIGTTDLVSRPALYFRPEVPLLLVSFARSGDSPESVGAIQAADRMCTYIRHLIITCNQAGKLAQLGARREDCCVIELAQETNDRSFAMTSSYSNMYLAVLLALLPQRFADQNGLEAVCSSVRRLQQDPLLSQITDSFCYERIVFLGTAELKGIAQESALKTLELTAGRVTAIFDSPMGFRHGPKSIVNSRTLIVLYLSDDALARRYEKDLLREMSRQRNGDRILVITNGPDAEAAALSDWHMALEAGDAVDSALLALLYLPAAQLLALYKSASLGISADNPCPTGEVNRVVKGVTIYPI